MYRPAAFREYSLHPNNGLALRTGVIIRESVTIRHPTEFSSDSLARHLHLFAKKLNSGSRLKISKLTKVAA